MKRALQSVPASAQQAHGDLDATRRLRDLLGVGAGEWLRTDQIATAYAFPSSEAARKFIRRHVPHRHCGRVLLVDRRDVEAALSKRRAKVKVA